MCEIPSNVILAAEFAEIFDGFSIGSNDLTQLTLGVDRDSEIVAHVFVDEHSKSRELQAEGTAEFLAQVDSGTVPSGSTRTRALRRSYASYTSRAASPVSSRTSRAAQSAGFSPEASSPAGSSSATSSSRAR